ncbi:MAG: response regulator [Lachnospiraceae bacterium]|nr:response regulator [Lachnospiraceae bacterium]
MYRVMLIDDETAIRRLMQVSIDWKSTDMEVVGEAASGIEAINTIDEIRPDLCFVDISMPFMDGIEFTELATKRYPDLIIIIMTALDDFEYARKCVRLPVMDYMVKPVMKDDVHETLLRAKKKLDLMAEEKKAKEGVPAEPSAPSQEEFLPDPDNASSMEQIKYFLKEHYTDPQLNLTGVAQHFGFSASYLSRRFKQETGTNFLEYLTSCRMRKAMEMASRGTKMFCTAEAVGIPDPNYFGRCFKKYTGVSYSDYVQEHKIP